MPLIIKHNTRYSYEQAIFPEPHHLYFFPLACEYYTVEHFSLDVSPTPAGLSRRVDAESNTYYQCWFNEALTELTISVDIQLETFPFNPFNYLVEEDRESPPMIVNYLQSPVVDDEMKGWLASFEGEKRSGLITYLSTICQAIRTSWMHEIRREQTLLSPDQCFRDQLGSCRDLAWMMIQLLRQSGIPSKYVSGYCYNPELEEGHELHAWVDAWLPGAGWVGLDPSSGLFTNEYYIPVATSGHPANTLPVQGKYRGQAGSTLETSVIIEKK